MGYESQNSVLLAELKKHNAKLCEARKMIKFECWVKRTGSTDNHFYVDEKYLNIIFFGFFRWHKAFIWTVYHHDFSNT